MEKLTRIMQTTDYNSTTVGFCLTNVVVQQTHYRLRKMTGIEFYRSYAIKLKAPKTTCNHYHTQHMQLFYGHYTVNLC